MTFSNLTRWGGLAAVAAGVLFIIADLVALFVVLVRGSAGGLLFRPAIAVVGGVLLLLGLVGLYARRSEALGVLGLVGFLAAFAGLVWGEQNFLWAPLLASVGWVLFGAASLRAAAYPRGASVLLIVGAVLTGVVNALIGARPAEIPPSVVGVGAVADIIFFAAVIWLGYGLFTRRGEEPRRLT